MRRIISLKLITLLLFSTSFVSFAQNEQEKMHLEEIAPETEGKQGIKEEIKEYINHHLLDSHDFGLFSYETMQESINTLGFRFQ